MAKRKASYGQLTTILKKFVSSAGKKKAMPKVKKLKIKVGAGLKSAKSYMRKFK